MHVRYAGLFKCFYIAIHPPKNSYHSMDLVKKGLINITGKGLKTQVYKDYSLLILRITI